MPDHHYKDPLNEINIAIKEMHAVTALKGCENDIEQVATHMDMIMPNMIRRVTELEGQENQTEIEFLSLEIMKKAMNELNYAAQAIRVNVLQMMYIDELHRKKYSH